MIHAWFNQYGYKVVTEKGKSNFFYDLPDEVINDASQLYIHRWTVLNQMLDVINELSETIEDRDLVLYTDSRIIEELKGELTPDNEYAKSSLQYFIECDYVNFRRVAFQKCAETTINNKLLSERVNQKGY